MSTTDTVQLAPQSTSNNQWVLASNNKGKLAEFKRLFAEANLDVTIVPQGQLNIDDAIEDGLSFVENAIIKARHASRLSGLLMTQDCACLYSVMPPASTRRAMLASTVTMTKTTPSSLLTCNHYARPSLTHRLRVCSFACWLWCVMQMTRYPLLLKAYGAVRS